MNDLYWDSNLPYIAPEDEQEEIGDLYARVYAARDHEGITEEIEE